MKKVLQVGCTVWTIDANRRVYGDDFSSGPIFRGYFEARVIVGQTRLSWILDNGAKVSKRDAEEHVFTTEKQVDDLVWVETNRESIVDAIRGLSRRRDVHGAEALREVARVLGVKELQEQQPPKRYRRDGPCLITS